MQIRQEQIVFAVALVVVGAMFARSGDEGGNARRPARDGEAPDLDRFTAPDAERLTTVGVSTDLERALFSPPRDTRPLDPLSFSPPPLPPLVALAPPPVPGPAPRAYARLLQTVPPDREVEGLFEVAAALQGDFDLPADLLSELEGLDGDVGVLAGLSAEELESLTGQGMAELEALGYVLEDEDEGGGDFVIESEYLDAEERRQREASYYRIYDWIRIGEVGVRFGRIENQDPYGLRDASRATEPIVFQELEPDTGTPRFGGAPPIEYERTRVVDFGLSDTTENRLRQDFHDLEGPPTPGTVEAMLALAERCLAERLEVPAALSLAESLFARVEAAYPDDPRGGVGLARTYEAGFEFERAAEQYQRLLERFDHRAEVLAGLARLEARFRLFDTAEARLRRAVSIDRSAWIGHAELGRLMLRLGRYDEARSALADAFSRLPASAGLGRERLAVRLDYGAALLAVGDVTTAGQVFRDAVQAEADSQPALAGLAAAALLGDAASERALPGWLAVGDDPPVERFDSVGHELLLARGLLATDRGELLGAVRSLRAAAAADPLRAAPALRTLSWVAEIGGDLDTAVDQIEAALVADPTDPWSHYQHGRLLLARDELEDATDAFRRALEAEADFEDALVGLGVTAWRRARSQEAELYFERAELLVGERLAAVEAGADVARSGGEARADLLALRGINLLDLGELLAARELFRRALEVEPNHPPSLAGLAWAIYRLGDVEEALIQLRSIDDSLRNRPQDDPMRVWARDEIERVSEHVAKDAWTDRFEYTTLGNSWRRREAAGPTASLEAGELVLAGNFRTIGEVRFERDYEASKFVSIEARLRVSADSNARAGLFVSRETGQGDRKRVQAYAAVARSRDGLAQVKTIVPGREQNDWIDLPASQFPFPADEWVRLTIERTGEGAETEVTIYMDGIPVLEGVTMSNLARGNNPLLVGLFAEGDTGRRVEVHMDDVEVVRTRGVQ